MIRKLIVIAIALSMPMNVFADRYWIGNFTWVTDSDGKSFWGPPQAFIDESYAVLDFRNDAEKQAQGGTPSGYGFFSFANESLDLSATHFDLGTDMDRVLTGAERAQWRQEVFRGNGSVANGATIREVIRITFEEMGDSSDTPALTRTSILSNGRMKIVLRGQTIVDRDFQPTDASAANVQLRYRNVYRRMRNEDLAANPQSNRYRKVLYQWTKKMNGKVTYRWFQPDDVPDEPPLSPSTTYTDNFNRTDQDGLGTASGGFTWTDVQNQWDIVSNTAKPDTNPSTVRAEADLSDDDHYAQADATHVSSRIGLAVRFSTSAHTNYASDSRDASGTTHRLFRFDAGTGTLLTSSSGGNKTTETLKLEIIGTTLTLYSDGSSVLSTTDSTHSGFTRCGLNAVTNTSYLDNYTCEDFAVAATNPPRQRRVIGVIQ